MSADPDHPHTGSHDHDHGQEPPSATALRVKALESLLVEKGLVDPAALDAIIDYYENKVGPRNGARVVARAWTDTAYKARLLADATAAIAELGYSGNQGEHMVAVENTPALHNVIVCTLCSCYPWAVLGLPPNWYKSAAYRSRVVIEPRAVLREFGLDLPEFRRGARLGFDGRGSLPGLAGTPCRHREHERRPTRRAGHARCHGRHRPGARAMNGVHDMGGMHGFGPLVVEPNEPVFHEPWEGRVYALVNAIGAWGRWNIDAFRHQQERMPAADYLRASYYERWLFALIENVVRHGLVTREEVESGRSAPGAPKLTPPLQASMVAELRRRGIPTTRSVERQPRYRPGDAVRTRNIHPLTHTRLPRYARDKRGVIIALHGAHVFPDTNAHFQGENPQPLYTVRFEARALWGDGASSRDTVCLDLWEDYLDTGLTASRHSLPPKACRAAPMGRCSPNLGRPRPSHWQCD